MEENQEPKIIVKEVTGEEKSRAQVEETLLKKHEEKFEAKETPTETDKVSDSPENTINEEVKEQQSKNLKSPQPRCLKLQFV